MGSTSIYECRNCGVLATQKATRCPACGASSAPGFDNRQPYRRVDADEFLRALK